MSALTDPVRTAPDSREVAAGGTGPENPVSAALDPHYVRSLTDGVVATSGRTATTYCPFDARPLAEIPQSSSDDVAEAFRRARRAQQEWAAVPAAERAARLLALHDLVLDRRDEIVDLICWESGKSRKHAYDEPLHVAMTARYYARTVDKHLGPSRRLGVVPGLTRVEVNRVPKGVVGIISPWNYPFTMALSDGLPALLAGNAVVHKPDAQTMLSALLGTRLLADAGIPTDLWQVVAGPGSELGPEIIGRSDYVCFTGSTRTGRLVAEQAGRHLIGCSLELGGKNPMLVLRDADIEKAAEGAVRGCFSSAGQLCVSLERLYVADQVYDRFVERFVQRTEALRLGPGLDWGTDVGSLISADQLARVREHVDDAVAHGARVLTGGRHRPDLGPYFFEPTVLEGVDPRMTCFGDETFGPVVSLYRYHDEEDGIARANEGEYGLNAAVYTRDTRRGRALARRIRCGTVNVNESFAASFASLDAPMGGMRLSGLGRRQGEEGIRRYTDAQTVAVQRVLPIAPVRGMSDEGFARLMSRQLRLLRRTGRP